MSDAKTCPKCGAEPYFIGQTLMMFHCDTQLEYDPRKLKQSLNCRHSALRAAVEKLRDTYMAGTTEGNIISELDAILERNP